MVETLEVKEANEAEVAAVPATELVDAAGFRDGAGAGWLGTGVA